MKDFIRKYKKNFILVFLIGFAVYFFILFKNDAEEIKNKIKDIQIPYILIALLLFLIFVILESLILHILTVNKVKGIKFKDSFQVNLATQFFNSVTPFASGGHPFQVLYLNARGIKIKDSTSIILMNFISYSLSFVIVGLVFLVFKFQYFNNLLRGQGYNYLLLIGFGVNIFATSLTFFLAFSKKIYHLLVEVIWLKIIHWPFLRRFNLENKTDNIVKTIDDFNHEIKELNKHKLLWLESVSLQIIRILINNVIPLFIFLALGENVAGNEINLVVGAFFVAMVMSYIPSPGASGGAEGLFYIIFGVFFDRVSIIAAMLLWRFITYYFTLFLGFGSLFTLNYKKDLYNINYGEYLETNES